jgi:hypothetical protein
MVVHVNRAFIPLLYLLSFSIQAQQKDSTAVDFAAAKAIAFYNEAIKIQSGLFVGSQYKTPARTNDDHPFYRDFDWQQGSVIYNGEQYDKADMLYDVYNDDLIVENYYNGNEIVLVKEKVSAFSIGNDKFVKVSAAEASKGLPSEGFYRLCNSGQTKVLARHWKSREERVESTKLEIYFTPHVRFYVLHDGNYHKVSKRAELIKLFADKKSEVRSFIQKEHLTISRKNGEAIAVVAQFYDSLKPQN